MKAIAVAALLGLSLSLDIKKDIGDAIHDAGNVASIISTGSQIASHLYADDDFKVNGHKILQDAGDAAKIIGTGLSIADHLYAEDNFKVNGQKILNDAGDVAKVIGTGLSIADHLYAENDNNAEELFNIKKIGQDIGKVAKVALPIAGLVADAALFDLKKDIGDAVHDADNVASIVSTGSQIASHLYAEDNFKVNGQKILNDAGDVAKVIGTGLSIADHLYAEDNFKVNGEKILNDAGTVAGIIGTGLKVADHLYVENGDNAEELLNIKKIGEDIGKVAKDALPIAGLVADAAFADDDFKVNGQKILNDAGDVAKVIGTGLSIADHLYAEDNFKVNGQKILHDAGEVAGVIGTGLKIADHFAFFETESGEEKGFLSF